MKVNEIFTSIDGEGIRQGFLSSFVRMYGCNLKCNYCDTRYACENDEFKEISIDQILSNLETFNVKRVTITGGEPLLQSDIDILVDRLLKKDFLVNIETNGSIDPSLIWTQNYRDKYKEQFILTMDYKTFDSKMNKMMKKNSFLSLNSWDVLKFVVQSKTDLDNMKNFLEENNFNCHIYVSAVYGKIEPKEIVDYMQKNNLNNIRLQLQIHKFIWDPKQRAV